MVKSSKRKVKPKSNEKVSKTTNHTINSGGRTKISSLYNRVKIPIRPLNLEHPYKNSFGKKYQNSSVNNSNFNWTPENKISMNASFSK